MGVGGKCVDSVVVCCALQVLAWVTIATGAVGDNDGDEGEESGGGAVGMRPRYPLARPKRQPGA